MSVKRIVAFADFETTKYNAELGSQVYCWAICSKKMEKIGDRLESFMEYIRKKKLTIYFHNVKWDFEFIHYFLLENEIEYEILEKKGQIYSVKFWDIEIRDTSNIFTGMSVADIGKEYNKVYFKSYEDIIQDYYGVATIEQQNRCLNDCKVIEEGYNNYMESMYELLVENGAVETAKKLPKKLTKSSIAFDAFKELSNHDKLIVKTTQAEYEEFKGAYKGGYVYSIKDGVIYLNVKMIDNNSLYPWVYSTKALPIGKPILTNNIQELQKFKFYIMTIKAKFSLRKGFIPIIGGGIGRYGSTTYLSDNVDPDGDILTICNIDLELFEKFYDFDYQLITGSGFEVATGIFEHYANVFKKIKNSSKGVKRRLAKELLNSPYGKEAMNGCSEVKEYKLNNRNIIEGKVVRFEVNEDVYQNLPLAIAITAHARYELLTTAMKIGFDKILYMDTDSIKYQGDTPSTIYMDAQEFGAWKDEGTAELFKTIACKKYVTYMKDKLEYTCAGFSKKALSEQIWHGWFVFKNIAKHLIKQFGSGLQVECLQNMKVKGGRALVPIMKEIR